MTDSKTIQNKRRKSLPLLIAAQLLIAIITVAIILIVAWKIKPLIEKKAELEKTVLSLENTIGGLEKNINDGSKEKGNNGV
jgi:cell division protein FtsL